ncbi:MAG: RNA pseudouridine synthase [Myxococcota bacterium]
MSICVVYSDEDCVVVDKPAGMPSHPLKDSTGTSALEVVCELYPEIKTASDNPLEGGMAHRLDTGTSGLLVFARTKEAYTRLREAFSKGQIEKTYVALVEGEIKAPLVIDYPIAHHPKNQAKMLAITPKNKYYRGKPQPARTEVTPLPGTAKVGRGHSRIGVKIIGGRRHQIRVHLASIGHPLVGDTLYGAEPITWREGHALHADSITLPNGQVLRSTGKETFTR